MASQTLAEFLAKYDPSGERTVAIVDAEAQATGDGSPFVVVRCGPYTAVISAMKVGDYLDLDIHSFADGKDAAAGVFGMTEGKRFKGFENTGKTSNGWPAANLVAVLIGKQEHTEHCEGCGCEKEGS